MKEQVLAILKSVRPDVDFVNETMLIDSSILDSFDVIEIVTELNEHFDIDITADELEPESFNSWGAITALVEALQ